MLIDWFTVIAQIFNFLILVWLLRRFLYTPILNAIDEREKRIKTQIQEAHSKKEEAEEERKRYEEKNEAFEKEREERLQQVTAEANEKRKELFNEVREKAEKLRLQLESGIYEAKEHLNREIIARTQKEIFEITRKVLRDLASADLESHIFQLFVKRLRNIKEKKIDQFVRAIDEDSAPITVFTGFELESEQQTTIKNVIQEITGRAVECKFIRKPEMISGFELTVGGYKLAWSITDYLYVLEKELVDLLEGNAVKYKDPIKKSEADESS